jgi:hypothetical protein
MYSRFGTDAPPPHSPLLFILYLLLLLTLLLLTFLQLLILILILFPSALTSSHSGSPSS